MKKTFFILLPFLISCTNLEMGKIDAKKITNTNIKNLNLKSKLKINILNKSFRTKASENSALEATSENVVSYEVFLTTNKDNPFESGANPNGDEYSFYFDKDDDITSVTIEAPISPDIITDPISSTNPSTTPSTSPSISPIDIPIVEKKPYYVVVAAYDKESFDSTKKNITKENTSFSPLVTGVNRKFVISINTVTINNDLEAYFNPVSPEEFSIELELEPAKPLKIQTEIKILDGNPLMPSFTAQ